MVNVLFSAGVYRHIAVFHIPYIKLLQEKGYDVYVASTEDYGNSKEKLEQLNVKCIDIPYNRNPLSIDNYIAYKGITELFKRIKFDIIHVHSPVAAFLVRGARKYVPNGKMIYTAHGFHFFKGAPLKNWLFYFPLELINVKNTDVLITINSEDTETAKKLGFPEYKVVHINGVGVDIDIDSFSEEAKRSLKQALKISEEKCIITYVAEFNNNKNHMFLLRNWKKIKEQAPNAVLLLAGLGPNVKMYKNYIEQEELADIQFLGYRDDMDNILQISDVITLLSFREGLPKSIMEGMAHNLPCVVTNTRGLRDLVDHYYNGFVIEQGDDLQLIKSFVTLINNPVLRQQMGSKSREKIKNFSYDAVIKEYRKVYDQK
ncbi:glycosyltransferase family 4 protein [Macrococcus equipercicus]|uniref:Glycosyltransferase family 4 protein n=1 Tax=Macrococcus equipercicus TaxID=69967 RepID=A0ABQ6R876_9STAP|nr:glycosyltransferase family 4 protein [Macrococcus equipercicus]KAA1039308.1 glycosyltransferase family 4 protein [Macrococcus equipercicus]